MAMMLAVIMMFSLSARAMAAEKATASVGTLTLFAANTGAVDNFDVDTGHSFLMFTNTSGSSKQVGVYTVQAGKSVTIGTWPGSKHYGIWYNLECYAHHQKDKFDNRVSLTISISASQLATMNELIAENDEYNLTSDNCVDFALEIWYAMDTIYIFSTGTPSSPNVLLNSMKTFEEHQLQKSIPNNTSVGYASNGKFVSVSTSNLSDMIDKLYAEDTEVMDTGDGTNVW